MARNCWLNNGVFREADLVAGGCWFWVLKNDVAFSSNVISGCVCVRF